MLFTGGADVTVQRLLAPPITNASLSNRHMRVPTFRIRVYMPSIPEGEIKYQLSSAAGITHLQS